MQPCILEANAIAKHVEIDDRRRSVGAVSSHVDIYEGDEVRVYYRIALFLICGIQTMELVLLYLQDGVSIDDSNLDELKEAATTAGIFLDWFRQVEDITKLYLVTSEIKGQLSSGVSKSVAKLLESRQSLFSIEWTLSLDIEHSALPLNAPVMAIGRHFIQLEKAEEFHKTFLKVKHHLESFPALLGLAGGWRTDHKGDAREWVLFTGWGEVSKHRTFANSEGFQQYKKIQGVLSNYEVKHAIGRH